MVYTYLLTKDFDSARQYYAKTVELFPRGYFTAITALDTLTREKNGNLPAGTYLADVSLEWIDNREKKAGAMRQLVKGVPQVVPAGNELSGILAGCDPNLLATTAKVLSA